jgi:hypothetical protein
MDSILHDEFFFLGLVGNEIGVGNGENARDDRFAETEIDLCGQLVALTRASQEKGFCMGEGTRDKLRGYAAASIVH